jgi:hypothetical protein
LVGDVLPVAARGGVSQFAALARKIIGSVKLSPESATRGGGAGTGPARRIIASAASSKERSPEPRTTLTERTIDLPPGPEADASTASPAVVEQKVVVEQTDLPKAVPTETEDPDRLVTPTDVKKPNDDDPKITTAQAIPSVESVESEATTAPTVEAAPEGPRSLAPAIGPGESMRRERLTWQRELAAHLDRHKRYPNDGASQSVEIVLGFALDRAGRARAAILRRTIFA